MLAGKRNTNQLICVLAFLLGCAAACLTGYFCSAAAITGLKLYLSAWLDLNGDLCCLAGTVVFALFAMLCSASVFGFILIPAANAFFGYCLTFSLIALWYEETCIAAQLALRIPSFLSVLPLLRISAMTMDISCSVSQLWRSNGIRSFDLHGINRQIWTALFILILLYELQRFLDLII